MAEIKRMIYDAKDRKDILTVKNRKGAVHAVTRMHFNKFMGRDGLQIVQEEKKKKGK